MRDEESLITEYFNQGYSHLEILAFLLNFKKASSEARFKKKDSAEVKKYFERFYILNYLVFLKLETLFKT